MKRVLGLAVAIIAAMAAVTATAQADVYVTNPVTGQPCQFSNCSVQVNGSYIVSNTYECEHTFEAVFYSDGQIETADHQVSPGPAESCAVVPCGAGFEWRGMIDTFGDGVGTGRFGVCLQASWGGDGVTGGIYLDVEASEEGMSFHAEEQGFLSTTFEGSWHSNDYVTIEEAS